MSENLKTAAVSAAIAAVVCVVGFWLVGGNQPAPVAFGGSSDSGWDATGDGCLSVDGTCIIDASGNVDGALTSSAIITTTDDNISINSVSYTVARDASLEAASTTICALQSPAATSTLQSASVLLTTSSTSASTITLAKAATAFATTTLLNTGAVAAGAQATIIASTTSQGGTDQASVFGPSQWFVAGMSGGTGTFSPSGVCSAVWREVD